MDKSLIGFVESGRVPKVVSHYLQDDKLKSIYGLYPNAEELDVHSVNVLESFSKENRLILAKQLKKQYSGLSIGYHTQKQLEELEKDNTVCITTGHQLSLMLGPVYVIYKIISTIKLTSILNEHSNSIHYVPIFWMATEDHDFEEISFFEFEGIRFKWERPSKGFVGEMDLSGLDYVLNLYKNRLGKNQNAQYIKKLVEISYRQNTNIADATRAIVHELFAQYGLLILDPNSKTLKEQFIPYFKDELINNACHQGVKKTIRRLKLASESNFKPQVNPREINLFYKNNQGRFRIVNQNGHFQLVGNPRRWSENELIEELEKSPHNFSPNVLTRGLYQQVILPNVAYIGGSAELAYWLELIDYFEDQRVVYPKLIMRNSAVLVSHKQSMQLKKLSLSYHDLFMDQNALINKHIRSISNIDLSLDKFKILLRDQFRYLKKLTKKTDGSFLGAVAAQEKKQFNGIEKLEKRLLKAQKRKLQTEIERLSRVHEELFPGQTLQERKVNFSHFYKLYGNELFERLFQEFDPLGKHWNMIRFPNSYSNKK